MIVLLTHVANAHAFLNPQASTTNYSHCASWISSCAKCSWVNYLASVVVLHGDYHELRTAVQVFYMVESSVHWLTYRMRVNFKGVNFRETSGVYSPQI